MSQTRLTDFAVLSIERELADGLNFEILIVLLITLPKKSAKSL